MKAVMINPWKQEVSLIEMDGGLTDLYNKIECTTVEAPVSFYNGDTLWCDEEAWFKSHEDEGEAGFEMKGWMYAINGRGVILGTDLSNGECKEVVNRNIEYWESQITWKDHDDMVDQGERMGLI